MFDLLLSEYRPFCDSDYIHEQFHFCYSRRLRKISAVLPEAGYLLDALDRADAYRRYRVMGDTVVRCVIQQALRQIVTQEEYGLPFGTCKTVLEQTARHLNEGECCGPLEATTADVNRLGVARYHGWFWTEEHDNDVFGDAFRQIILQNYGESLCTPNKDEMAMVQKGAKLLEELLPSLSSSALSHAHLVALFPPIGNWKGRASGSQFRISGTIFLNREALQNPWWVAEHLLHESLHQKLYDFRHGYSLLVQDSLPPPGDLSSEFESVILDRPGVLAPWNIPGLESLNFWDTHRAVAAFHVYVHLGLFCSLAEQRVPELEGAYGPLYGRPPVMTRGRTAFDRAHYLGENIVKSCWNQLGRAGQLLVEWLTSVLDALDPAPPPKGSFVHLLLDRYIREANSIERREAHPDLTRHLAELTEEEVGTTRNLLRAINAYTRLSDFNATLANLPENQPCLQFCQVRKVIAKTLLEVCPDGYTLRGASPEGFGHDEILRRMVEDSSRKLAELGA
jgi:hypothetical protein